MLPLWVIGASGHAKVVIDTANASSRFRVVGVFDDCRESWGQSVLGVPVLGGANREVISAAGVERAVIAIGSNSVRTEVVERLRGLFDWATVVHPTAYLASGISLGEGTVVFANAIVQVEATIGRHVILNTASTVDHNSCVEDFAHLAPGVHLAGYVRVGQGAFFGVGACVRPHCYVGPWATVGAGSVVVGDIPARAIAFGVPSRPRK